MFTASLTGTLFSQATPKLVGFASLLADPQAYLGQTIALHGAGVYASTDGGNTWALYGTGLPDVEVFDLKLQSPGRILRAATHGLGVFEISVPAL